MAWRQLTTLSLVPASTPVSIVASISATYTANPHNEFMLHIMNTTGTGKSAYVVADVDEAGASAIKIDNDGYKEMGPFSANHMPFLYSSQVGVACKVTVLVQLRPSDVATTIALT